MADAALETGAVVQVTHVASSYSFRALVERGSSSGALVLSLCSMERPYEKLKVALNGHVSWALAAAKFASFLVEIEEAKDGSFLVHFKSLAHQKKISRSETVGWFLGVASTPSLGLIGDAGKGDESLFRLTVVSTRAAFALDPTRSLMTQSRHSSILSESQRRSFIQHGYLQIRGAVSLPLANAALRRINHDLGIPGNMIDGGVEGNIKLAGNTSNSDAILDLYYLSDVCKYVEALVGADQIVAPQGAQIALRFPELGEPREPLGTEWHTDGMRQGRLHPFTLLAGIALSNVPEPLCGNLTVFPGSHVSLHSRLTADGKLRGYDDECYKAGSVWGDGTLPDLGVPVQLLAARGDLVLAHPNLAHRGGLNFSPDIRYQVYFRIKHKQLDQLQDQCTTDLWADLQGLSLDDKNYIAN
ncbi:Protein involved in biosynthesis of mitomycin antibiotics/polyketide fumonisin [Phytophthora cinnamomi]|uniref:Protein involved in biosynthesis of mitomycin antibiotics/polyketide fumonisin n=1 Tax=Phytophthora cinnamomi TaxID=4785 RepID=UPI003559C4AC|nr:Protein involved in biosynthesis of mitomycin antibiotics/polyketide fumonisin [Phytophthora cinnamomi]